MDRICIYLRKSRADEEIEKEIGQGETLKKHRKTLLEFASKHNLNIVEIKEELVSGDSIFFRPKVLELLKEVESGMYTGVLVMDVQRLGRGDTEDQGIIEKVFKKSHTKIITPMKSYDLDNEYDEDYYEFEAFMGHKEYKMINRRLQNGRIRSIKDGNYMSPLPPYGYNIYKEKYLRTLTPNPEQAPVVKMIFDMYVNKNYGCNTIAYELNSMGYKSYTGNAWGASAISNILKSPVYIGELVWGKKYIRKSTKKGKKKDVKQRPKSKWLVVNGKHKPLIDKETFEKAQEIIDKKYHIPYQLKNGPRNPLAGLIICGICGSKMVYRPYGNKLPHIICPKCCGNKSSKFIYVEDKVLKGLKQFTREQKLNINIKKDSDDNVEIYLKQIKNLQNELEKFESQKLELYDLVERKVYDIDTFLSRSKNISDRIAAAEKSIEELKIKVHKNKKVNMKNIIEKIEKVIDLYNKTADISEKNMLLKSVLEKAVYKKEKDQCEDDFSLTVYPKVY